ncbi:hypothetical protein [Niveispirillum fermenti]|uniref:hypothetical protein n=1 Tax=Niveispirillum fermenti TaxID=1233113 RepID=UPI003A89CD9A
MRAVMLLFIAAALGLGMLAFATFRATETLAPLPLAGRGAIAAAFIGAGLLFGLFVWLQRQSRRRDRDRS